MLKPNVGITIYMLPVACRSGYLGAVCPSKKIEWRVLVHFCTVHLVLDLCSKRGQVSFVQLLLASLDVELKYIKQKDW